jgi:hypothetical protein
MLKIQRLWCLAWIIALPALAWGQIRISTSGSFSSSQISEKRDSFGNQWSANANTGGLTGTTSSTGYSEAATLRVNGTQFSPSGRTANSDGSEYVFTGSAAGVQITRRIRFDLQNGIVRVLDTFQNDGNAAANLSVSLSASMRYPIANGITETGKPFQNSTQIMLAPQDSGFMVASPIPIASAVAFYVGGQQAKVKPAIQTTSSSVTIAYSVTVPAKRNIVLVSGIGQRQSSGSPSAEMVSGLFKLFRSRDFVRDIPAELRRTIANGSPITGGNAPARTLVQPMTELANRWNVERGKTEILVLDNDTTLTGTVSGSELAVTTRFGSTTIALDKVSAVAGGGETQKASRIFLRNGEILTGEIEAKDFVFRADNGLVIRLDARKLNALFMRTDPSDGKPQPEVIAFVETQLGTHLAVQAKSPLVLDVATAWGTLSVPLADIDQLYLVREPQPIHRLVLKDKSRLSVILRGNELALNTTRFGTVKLTPAEIVGIHAAWREPEKADESDETRNNTDAINAPHFQLLDDNAVVGTFDIATIDLMTGAGTTPIKTANLQNLEKGADRETANSFRLALADGSRLTGRLAMPVVAIRTTHGTLEAPLGQILGFRNDESKANPKTPDGNDPPAEPKPSPAKSPGTRSPLDNMFGIPSSQAKPSAGGPN